MTGFKPRSSGVRSDHSVNCATTTAQDDDNLKLFRKSKNATESSDQDDVVPGQPFLMENWLRRDIVAAVID